MESNQSVESLIGTLEDGSKAVQVRSEAAIALGKIEEKSVILPLVNILENSCEEKSLRLSAISSLEDLIPQAFCTNGNLQLMIGLSEEKILNSLTKIAATDPDPEIKTAVAKAMKPMLTYLGLM